MLVVLGSGLGLADPGTGAGDLLGIGVEPLSHLHNGVLELGNSLGSALGHLTHLGTGLGVLGQALLSQTSHNSSRHPELVLFVSVHHLHNGLGRVVSEPGLESHHSRVATVSGLVPGHKLLLELLDRVWQVVERLLVDSVCLGACSLLLGGVDNLVESLHHSLGVFSGGDNALVLDEGRHHLVEPDGLFADDSGLVLGGFMIAGESDEPLTSGRK